MGIKLKSIASGTASVSNKSRQHQRNSIDTMDTAKQPVVKSMSNSNNNNNFSEIFNELQVIPTTTSNPITQPAIEIPATSPAVSPTSSINENKSASNNIIGRISYKKHEQNLHIGSVSIITRDTTGYVQNPNPATPPHYQMNRNLPSSSTNSPSITGQTGQRCMKQEAISYYQSQIDGLEIRQTLKSYLLRTLHSIILSSDHDKILLLEIRKQLKASSRIAEKPSYSRFLQLIDELYMLAVDKSISSQNNRLRQLSTMNQLIQQNATFGGMVEAEITNILQPKDSDITVTAAAATVSSDMNSNDIHYQTAHSSGFESISSVSPRTSAPLSAASDTLSRLTNRIQSLHNSNAAAEVLRTLQRNALMRISNAFQRRLERHRGANSFHTLSNNNNGNNTSAAFGPRLERYDSTRNQQRQSLSLRPWIANSEDEEDVEIDGQFEVNVRRAGFQDEEGGDDGEVPLDQDDDDDDDSGLGISALQTNSSNVAEEDVLNILQQDHTSE